MMKNSLTPHDFLTDLRCRAPWAARLLDGARSLSMLGGVFTVGVCVESWPGSELGSREAEFLAEVRRFFGAGTTLAVTAAKRNPERLPLPVEASKYWNHVAFASLGAEGGGSLLAVRKTELIRLSREGEAAMDGETVFRYEWEAGGAGPVGDFVREMPEIADALTELARREASYAQIVAAFPGHEAADVVEAALYRVRDWGTPATPPAIIHKYFGRIHYVDPSDPPSGLKIVRAREQN